MKDEEDRADQAEGRGSVVPAQVLAKVESNENAENNQGDDFLNDFQLHRVKPVGSEAVGRDLEAVLEKGNTPTHEDDLPERLLPEAQMAIPREGHEDVGEDEKNDCPHYQVGRAWDGPGCRDWPDENGDTMTALAENLERLEEEIAAACRAAGRGRGEVELMAVSKTYPLVTMIEAAGLGLRLFGENRVQEFGGKALDAAAFRSACGDEQVRAHLIGHLQSNKATRAAELFDAVDSVDSVRLAERLNEAAGKLGKRLPVLIEVKLSAEETKAGLDPHSSEADALLERLQDLTNLETQGLMTIAPFDVAEDETRACQAALH